MLEKIFKLSKNNTNIKTEIVAGITTFITISYIFFVNPLILKDTGMDVSAVFIATCLVVVISSLLLAFYANLPLAIAPGMGLNAFFAYTIVLEMGYSWQNALAMMLISGSLFFILSLFLSKHDILKVFPSSLKYAMTSAIGAFIIFIALQNAGIIIANSATLVGLGNIKDAKVILVFLAFIAIVVAFTKKLFYVPVLVSILLTIISIFLGENALDGVVSFNVSPIHDTLFQFSFKNILNISIIIIITIMFLTALFDNVATFLGYQYMVGKKHENIDTNSLKKVIRIVGLTDIIAGLVGSSKNTIFLESNAGIQAGGRTGLVALVIGILALLTIFLSPLIKVVPAWATSPILMYIGLSMMGALRSINWDEVSEYMPAFVCLIITLLTYSISNGVGIAFITYLLIKLMLGKYKEITIPTWIVSIVFIVYFVLH